MVSYDGSNSDSFKEITINSKFDSERPITPKLKSADTDYRSFFTD